jgi:hypothetical protein
MGFKLNSRVNTIQGTGIIRVRTLKLSNMVVYDDGSGYDWYDDSELTLISHPIVWASDDSEGEAIRRKDKYTLLYDCGPEYEYRYVVTDGAESFGKFDTHLFMFVVPVPTPPTLTKKEVEEKLGFKFILKED